MVQFIFEGVYCITLHDHSWGPIPPPNDVIIVINRRLTTLGCVSSLIRHYRAYTVAPFLLRTTASASLQHPYFRSEGSLGKRGWSVPVHAFFCSSELHCWMHLYSARSSRVLSNVAMTWDLHYTLLIERLTILHFPRNEKPFFSSRYCSIPEA